MGEKVPSGHRYIMVEPLSRIGGLALLLSGGQSLGTLAVLNWGPGVISGTVGIVPEPSRNESIRCLSALDMWT